MAVFGCSNRSKQLKLKRANGNFNLNFAANKVVPTQISLCQGLLLSHDMCRGVAEQQHLHSKLLRCVQRADKHATLRC
jgi:hypothetical protein